MYRSSRHINKNDGQHNMFGEDDCVNIEYGRVITELEDLNTSQNEEEKDDDN